MKRLPALMTALVLVLTGCAPIDEPAAEAPVLQPEEPVQEEASSLPTVLSLPYLEGQPLNPLTCPDGMQQTVASLLYEGLFQLDADLMPQPILCEAYRYDPDALTYTLILRSDAAFSDGTLLTAADVRATLLAAKNSPRYARRLADITSIAAGDGSVTLILSRPNAALPALLDIPILKAGTEQSAVPTGTGPYLYAASEEPCLVASQNWWQRGSQPTDRIILVGTADRDAMLYRFTSHDVQLIVADLTGTDPVSVSGGVSSADAPTTVFQYLGVNTARLPDAALRRCLSLGLNRRGLVSGLLSGHAQAAQFPISPVSPLYPTDLEIPYSTAAFAQAAEELEARPSRPLRLLVNEENSFKVSVAQQIAAAFTDSGLPTEVSVLPWDAFTAALSTGSFDLYYGEVRLTADWDISALVAAGGSLNYGGWSDPDCDALLSACRTSTDRASALMALCRYLQDQAPILPLCFKTVTTLYETAVLEGLSPTATAPFGDPSTVTVHLQNS